MVQQEVIAPKDTRRNHHVRVHGPERQRQPPRQHGAPALGFPAGILVADQNCGAGFVEKCFE